MLISEMETCCTALRAAVQQAELMVSNPDAANMDTAETKPSAKIEVEEMKPIIRKIREGPKTEQIALKRMRADDPKTELIPEECPADPSIS